MGTPRNLTSYKGHNTNGYTITGKDRYGCATRRQKGTCDNSQTITRQEIESRVLDGLKDRLLAPDLVATFMAAMQDELNALRRNRQAEQAQRSRKIAEVERKISGMMRAIEDGLYEPAMKERLTNLKGRVPPRGVAGRQPDAREARSP